MDTPWGYYADGARPAPCAPRAVAGPVREAAPGRPGKPPLGPSVKPALGRLGDEGRAEGAVGRGVEDRGVGAEVADRGQVARVGF
jgi:hypothetical protein